MTTTGDCPRCDEEALAILEEDGLGLTSVLGPYDAEKLERSLQHARVMIGEPIRFRDVDRTSSASVQHYIETGRYLSWQERLEDVARERDALAALLEDQREELVELLALKVEVSKLALGARAVSPARLAELVAVRRG